MLPVGAGRCEMLEKSAGVPKRRMSAEAVAGSPKKQQVTRSLVYDPGEYHSATHGFMLVEREEDNDTR